VTDIHHGAEASTVAIIGAGFGGICMGIKLRRAGIPFVIFEKASRAGGVWRDNVYPGAACDIPSHLYSFSFEPSFGWSRTYGRAVEIQRYIDNCARKYGVLEHIRFNSEVAGMEFDPGRGRWRIDLCDGGACDARFVVAATGQLSRPVEPRIAGLETFPGKLFHSASWDHDYDLAGKTVAVIGSGASAIQFVPEIAPKVGKLHLFQRSAPYVLPKPDRPYTRFEKHLYRRLPIALAANRARFYLYHESRVVPMTKGRGLGLMRGMFMRNLRRQVDDPALRARLVPHYPIGCKRVLISNDWYPAITRPNVEVISAGLKEIRGVKVSGFDQPNNPDDSPAKRAGIEVGDVIIGVNGQPVDHVSALQRAIRGFKPGQTVSLDVMRFGDKKTLNVKLGEPPADTVSDIAAANDDRREPVSSTNERSYDKLGISVQPVPTDLIRTAKVGDRWSHGLLVSDVSPSGPAYRELSEGTSIIVRVLYPEKKDINSIKDFEDVVSKLKRGDLITLLVYDVRPPGVTSSITLKAQ